MMFAKVDEIAATVSNGFCIDEQSPQKKQP